MPLTRLAVVGNGMVGHHLLQQLADQGVMDQFAITVFSEESLLAYDRVQLTKYMEGRSIADLSLGSFEQYQAWGLEVKAGVTIETLDTESQIITASDGTQHGYDKLVLATGSYPFVPPVPGHDATACHVYRTIPDLIGIQAAADNARSGVVIGGGLLGLEAAKALVDLGLDTHVVEFADRLMIQQLDAEGGELLGKKIRELGVKVHTQKNTQAIVPLQSGGVQLQFADGELLETDLVVFSAGIRPRDQLARQAGLEVGERGGIVIDDQCQTSVSNVYAIGECALWQQRIFGLVAPGYHMAKVVATQLQSQEASFTGADMSTKLKLLGVDVASIGDAQGRTDGAKTYRLLDEYHGHYHKLVVDAEGQYLLGAILVGDASRYSDLLQIYLNRMPLPEHPEMLLLAAEDGASPMNMELPDSASICSCHNVSKGDVVQAVKGGCCSVAEVKAQTRAATGCGGCMQALSNVVQSSLLDLGMEVSRDLCEHFAYTRQELYDLVRVEELTSYEDVLKRHGHGLGCEICKPALASILASCWNDYVLANDHVAQQDSNDRYLANIQKDGSYSVVPRVPAGEIKPEQLIVLGEVAQEFGLYSKITGGQRVDLFGARLEQLPAIWQRLIDAGFETGHAYGKSVRTVKSCVGSTWCRYGVGNSVGLAIDLEHRYKGVRSPHKLKFAVSGCTRECAEAQSKDIGVIATEKGWNLYVCGNGGMRPRHADLLATDLDQTTLISYIDRLLMFYIKTADRLQRTSTWLEQLEGGLDYVRQVVIEDKLDIVEQLEAEMQVLVDAYQCEWTTTLADPEAVARFQPFVNTKASDDSIVMVSERDQIRPATSTERISLSKQAD
ncbi:MAG: nitrite reductase large subunit [Gammaproteobacteria bacterium]|jgi:nitrite reductase (NADH) large subunit|nr:nitrite reductase large subunit [Gammaproteobacteria bacterium]MCP4881421.1 nitrite reductase large subunit [Gammaproteobacteria bacterium]MDP6164872.1 nitrite reductase large subunit NirB [Gammaproteobacteria bacterium]